MTSRLRAVLLLGGAVAVAAALFLLVPNLTEPGAPDGPDEREKLPDRPTAPVDRPVLEDPPEVPAPAAEHAPPPGRRTPTDSPNPDQPYDRPPDPRFESTRKRLADLKTAFQAQEAYEGDSDEEKHVLQERYQRLTERLRGQVAASGDHARYLTELMDATEDEVMAIRLARILRSAEDESFVAFMADRVRTGEKPIHRRTAILTLENREADVWQAPVTRAYREDPAPAVRDEAAGLLSRSLVDRRYVTKHRELRATFVTSLDSADPVERVRGLDALLGDRTAGRATVEKVRALTGDPDAEVRRSAKRTLRVLEPRLSR